MLDFGGPFGYYSPSLFPTTAYNIHNRHVVAPYWSDNDARLNGLVSWEMYSVGDGLSTDAIIDRINSFINTETNNTNFMGSFVFVATWSEMHPYPAGQDLIYAEPYLSMVGLAHKCTLPQKLLLLFLPQNNSYQADGEHESYTIFTYMCGSLGWSGGATIGFNAGGDYYANHPLSGLQFSNDVSCANRDSVWTNVVYDLTPMQSVSGSATDDDEPGTGSESVSGSEPHQESGSGSGLGSGSGSGLGFIGVGEYKTLND